VLVQTSNKKRYDHRDFEDPFLRTKLLDWIFSAIIYFGLNKRIQYDGHDFISNPSIVLVFPPLRLICLALWIYYFYFNYSSTCKFQYVFTNTQSQLFGFGGSLEFNIINVTPQIHFSVPYIF